MTAYGHDLARVAGRIADQLELPAELVGLLSPACIPTVERTGSLRQSSGDERTPERAGRALSVPER
jgi:hypothetical protein